MDAQVPKDIRNVADWKPFDFLNHLQPGGPWVITAIVPDGKATTRTFAAKQQTEMQAFIERENTRKKNVYYSLGWTRGALSKKARKSDIASVAYLHVDADPNADEAPEQFKARITPQFISFGQQPTFVIDSGNGVQLLWRLDTPVPIGSEADIADIEARNYQLALAFGADPSTRNVDRILRVPGTTNWPNKKKLKDGRVSVRATVLSYTSISHALSAFPPVQESHRPRKDKIASASPTSRRLPQSLRLMLGLAGDKPAGYPSRSQLLYAFLHEGLRRCRDEEELITLCLDGYYRGKSIYEHVRDNGGRTYLEAQIEKIANDPDTRDGEKAIIRVLPNNLDQTWRQAQRALIRAKCEVFVRGGTLVQPIWRLERSYDQNRDTLVASLVKFNISRLRDMVGHHAATFQKGDQRHKASWKPVDPPRDIIEALLEAGHWDFPSIRGIINSPTMRRDGSLLTQTGYDLATSLWYKCAGDTELPPIAERPSMDNAKQALKMFDDLLEGFPFSRSVDKSVALAAILTTVLRGAFDVSPMFFISAPEAGTGKTYIVKLISTIATGRGAVPLAGTANSEEMEKRLSAAAFEGSPILSLNNLTTDLDSALLCQIVSEGVIKIRPFGKNDQTIPCDCRGTTVFANGNNIRMVGDLVRRTLTCRLDAKTDEPEKRQFAFDPIERVKSNRGAYLAAAFTIARAYMAAGRPSQATAASIAASVAGFDGWRRFVQLPLVWLGQDDPVKSMEDARAMDPERIALADRLQALVSSMGVAKNFTAGDVYNRAIEMTTEGGGYPKPKYPRLTEVYSRDGRNVNAKSIGNQLMKDIERVSGGYKLELVKKDPKSSHRYRLEAASSGPQSATPTEECAPPPDVF
ncbi:DNA-primase RepB domain-containing protein [Bradyrhizobium sp. HKCCYLRH1065]|uniref:DNA-primase RepB domain-containing protein n=1 Tax=Bradyrhizobium sp. HKCCYLRH1065 TaxID=3420753 RepID=UPI003EB8B038